jgi:hypothetical protein
VRNRVIFLRGGVVGLCRVYRLYFYWGFVAACMSLAGCIPIGAACHYYCRSWGWIT